MTGAYSLDKLVVLMRVDAKRLERLLKAFCMGATKEYGMIAKEWFSARVGSYKHNYTIALTSDVSYYLGVQKWDDPPNEYRVNIKLEFNPQKVGHFLEFSAFYNQLLLYAYWVDFGRFDIAVDVPVAREYVQLRKDQRRYLDYSYSRANRTEYLGQRSEHGQVKVYNKALEQGRSDDLTRVEITMDYANANAGEFKRIFPEVFFIAPGSVGEGIDGTDYVLLLACVDDINRLSHLPYRKRKKIEQLLAEAAQTLEPDVKQFKSILHEILTFGKSVVQPEPTADYTEDGEGEFPEEALFLEQQKMRIEDRNE